MAQCLDADVASLGETEGEAIANLREAKEAAFRAYMRYCSATIADIVGGDTH